MTSEGASAPTPPRRREFPPSGSQIPHPGISSTNLGLRISRNFCEEEEGRADAGSDSEETFTSSGQQ